MNRSAAEIVREYGPFPDVTNVGGVTYDGHQVWIAVGDKLNAFDPASGKILRSIDVPAHAGTAFDGQHLYQIADGRVQKIDPKTGQILKLGLFFVPSRPLALLRGLPGSTESSGTVPGKKMRAISGESIRRRARSSRLSKCRLE